LCYYKLNYILYNFQQYLQYILLTTTTTTATATATATIIMMMMMMMMMILMIKNWYKYIILN